jgi:ankyrin repeat protein
VSDIAAFFQAVQSGNASKVAALLAADASLANAKNEKGQSAVLLAVYTGRKEIRDLLLARGVALELHEAAAAGSSRA